MFTIFSLSGSIKISKLDLNELFKLIQTYRDSKIDDTTWLDKINYKSYVYKWCKKMNNTSNSVLRSLDISIPKNNIFSSTRR